MSIRFLATDSRPRSRATAVAGWRLTQDLDRRGVLKDVRCLVIAPQRGIVGASGRLLFVDLPFDSAATEWPAPPARAEGIAGCCLPLTQPVAPRTDAAGPWGAPFLAARPDAAHVRAGRVHDIARRAGR